MARYRQIDVGTFEGERDGWSWAARGIWISLFTDSRMQPHGMFRLSRPEWNALVSDPASNAALLELAPEVTITDRWVNVEGFSSSQGSGPKWQTAVDNAVLAQPEASGIPYGYPIEGVSMPLHTGTGAVTGTTTETGGSGGTPSPSISTKKKAKPKKPHDDPRELAALFGWWQEVWDKPRARLTKARKAALVERMKEDGYSLAEVYAGIAGHLFDDYDGRRRKQLGACEPHVLLRVNRQTKHDALEAGLEQFRSKDCHVKALSLMPPEYAVQMAESWGDLYRSEAIHKLLGLTPQQAERVREALNGGGEMTGTDWKCHAYRALVLHHNGEDLTEAARNLAEIAEPPDPRSVDVPPAMLDRMMDLGPVVDFGGAE